MDGHINNVQAEPVVYERPEHRNTDLEAYPLHTIWRRDRAYLDPLIPR